MLGKDQRCKTEMCAFPLIARGRLWIQFPRVCPASLMSRLGNEWQTEQVHSSWRALQATVTYGAVRSVPSRAAMRNVQRNQLRLVPCPDAQR